MKINVVEYIDYLELNNMEESEPIMRALRNVVAMYSIAGSKNVFVTVPKGVNTVDFLIEKYGQQKEVLVK